MFIAKKALSRRTFLRGAGTALALPFLDAMAPALAAQSGKPTPRLGFIYIPNGVIQKLWTPAETGRNFALSPTLAALEPVRNSINVLTGLDHWEAESKGDGTGDHPRASAAWLTGVHAYNRTRPGVQVRLAKTADQFAADVIGRDTRLASLEMTLERPTQGGCDSGDCFYSDTVSWLNETTPNMTEAHPRLVFERLFGDGGSPDQMRVRAQRAGSILDSVLQETARVAGALGPGDRTKLTEYLDSVREVERRIQRSETGRFESVETLERPTDIPASFVDHAHLMMDLAALAFQADVTRVFTLVIGRELTGRSYPHIGVRDGHHNISHHRGDADAIAKVAKIDAHHVDLLSYFLQKLQSLKDGSGALLEHSLVMYGGGMGDGNLHGHTNLPCLLAGNLGGRFNSGHHIMYPAKTPMANLLLTILDRVGVRLDRLGDSSGRLAPDPLSVA
ncbi:MAG TPA: DUF1552 domain-containing protein [Terriglobia bacterium]|nr:DUF1552 domain-containing protein [Terriglobia bacterium]